MQSESVEFRSLREAVWECAIGGSAKLVALRLVEHWPRMFPGLQSLASKTGLSERTVRDALRELEARRIINTTRRPNKTNVYAFLGADGQPVRIPALGTALGAPPPGGDSGGGGSADSAGTTDRQVSPHGSAIPAPPDRRDLPGKPSREAFNRKEGDRARARGATPPRVLFFDLEGWTMPAAWITEWTQRQLQPELLEGRELRLRGLAASGRISAFREGLSGEGRHTYLRGCFKEWLAFETVNARKAPRGAAFGSSGTNASPPAPWCLNEQTRAYALKWKIDVDSLAGKFVASGEATRAGHRAGEVFAKKVADLAAPRIAAANAAALAKTRQRSPFAAAAPS